MYNFLSSLAKILKVDHTKTDNEIFRLHYKVTLVICVAASLLVTGREYFGEPIACIPPGEELMQKIVDTYCWIQSTFTLPDSVSKEVGSEVAHPGVEKYTPERTRVYHKYYQWVCFALFFQGCCFYLPRYIWKAWESGRIKNLTQNLSSPIMTPDAKKEEISLLTSYIVSTMRQNDYYFAQFVSCEIMNLANVLAQIYFVDVFLGGEFSSFGLDVLSHTEKNQEERSDPMIKVFPRMTKCTFRFYGSSGDIQKHDTLCVLPLNVLNEKVYVFLWFWFMFLACISSMSLVYRTATILFVKVRYYVTLKRARMADKHVLRCIIHSIGISDWFLLHQLAKNMDPLNYRELLIEVARSIKSDRNGNGKALLSNRGNVESALGDTSIASYGEPL